jgi:enoyl-CoA hydratase
MTTTTDTPRPPDRDWLGTPYLRFTREGPFGRCTLDRPEATERRSPDWVHPDLRIDGRL